MVALNNPEFLLRRLADQPPPATSGSERNGVQAYLLVAIGGALGAALRYGVGAAFAQRGLDSFPYGTLCINVSGSLLIALFAGYAGQRPGLDPSWRYLFPIGFVGGYTTFSAYALELQRLLERGAPGAAVAYLAASNALGLAAVYAGLWLGRRV